MSAIATRVRSLAGLAMAAAMLFTTVGTTVGNGGPASYGRSDDSMLNAAVEIKTQKAADKIKNGVRGIDVSHWNGSINWKKVSKDNVNFAMVRASNSTTADTNFVANVNGAQSVGLDVGAYHYAKFTDKKSMKKEAKFFIKQLKRVDGLTYPVVLDLEYDPQRAIKKSTLTNLAISFIELVEAEGYDVMLYSYENFFLDNLNLKKLDSHKLWVANYSAEPKLGQVMWQHTSKGSVSGINGDVDINIAYSTLKGGKSSGGTLKVNKEDSDSIKQTLNFRYEANLDMGGLDMSKMDQVIIKGLQTELNRQMQAGLTVDGFANSELIDCLTSIDFVPGTTGGNITYLLQAKLFYAGCYVGKPNGDFDSYTVECIRKYQKQQGIAVSGDFDSLTLRSMFNFGW